MQPRRLTLQQVEIWTKPDSKVPIAVILDDPQEASAVVTNLGDGSKSADGSIAPEVPKSVESNTDSALSEPAWVFRGGLEDIEGQIVKVSISHDGEYCTAVALAPEMHWVR